MSRPQVSIDGEYITDCLVLGPFPQDLDIDYLASVGGEAHVHPAEGDCVTTPTGATVIWKCYHSPLTLLDLYDGVGNAQHATAYAVCLLQNPIAGTVHFDLQRNGHLAIWIDDQKVYHSTLLPYPLHPVDDAFEIELPAGPHRCLMKVCGVVDWRFSLRGLPASRAMIEGIVTDATGTPLSSGETWLEQDGTRCARAAIDESGRYRLPLFPVGGVYDLVVTCGELGIRHSGIHLQESDRHVVDLVVTPAASLAGAVLMPDGATPHVSIPVQVVETCQDHGDDPAVVATTLTDHRGQYRFINLRPGDYRVRCHVMGGMRYYGDTGSPSTEGQTISVREGQSFHGIDFQFASFKKGTWKKYTYLDGLVDNSIYGLYRDEEGLLWVTSQGGVSCYDGERFTNFTTSQGLVYYHVSAVQPGLDGMLWFSTQGGGVSQYDGERFLNYTTDDGLLWNAVHAMACDQGGTLWFGTERGLTSYDGHAFRPLIVKDGVEDYNKIWAVHCSPDGRLWFGGILGLSCYDGKTVRTFTAKDGMTGVYIDALASDQDGNLWIGTRRAGVFRYDGNTFTNFTMNDGLTSDCIFSIHCDPDGVLWFGTSDGLVRYDGISFVNFTTDGNLAGYPVYAIYTDPDGLMWLGMGNGLACYDRHTFLNLAGSDGLAPMPRFTADRSGHTVNYVSAIQLDANGRLWFASVGGGLACYDGERFVNYTTENGLPSNLIMSLYLDPAGKLWLGARGGGLVSYDGKRFVTLSTDDGLPSTLIWAMHGDARGNIWIALQEGHLVRYDGTRFESFSLHDVARIFRANSVYCDREGTVWVGTIMGGLLRFDGQHFEQFTMQHGLLSNDIQSIYGAPDGTIWVGTLGGGVSRFTGEGFETFTKQDGLAGNHVFSVYQEPDGDLWVGTNVGVSRYDGTTWMSMDMQDGLIGNNICAIYRRPDGDMLFGTERGVTRYRPNPTMPRARITGVVTDQRYTDLRVLPPIPAGLRMTFEYGAIDFKTAPHQGRYRYQLLGYDPEWSHPTAASQVDYTNLSPGTYTFQVQAIDRDLNYSVPATLPVTVQPDPRDVQLISLQTEVDLLRRQVSRRYQFTEIIGRSLAIRQVFELMTHAIDSGLTVLISGETGTGKEGVAKAIHYQGPRKEKSLLELNCGAVPKSLLASMLFGYQRGVFTGAVHDTPGLFEAAEGGTVLLDEIGEMDDEAQVHLLRVLEERKVQRIGEFKLRPVDVRILAITNRDLATDVATGRFRADLYYRLNVFPILLPPLRERPEDILLLTEHFLQRAAKALNKSLDGFASGVIDMFQSYPWPGNIRELKNEIDRAAALVPDGRPIQIEHCSPKLSQVEALIQTTLPRQTGYTEALNLFRYRLIEQVLDQCHGNRSQAARRLKMNRSNLISLIKRISSQKG